MQNHIPKAQLTIEEWIDIEKSKGIQPEVIISAMVKVGYAEVDAQQYVSKAFSSETTPLQNLSKLFFYQRIQKYAIDNFEPIIKIQSPCVMLFEHFLSEHECDTLIALSERKLTNSTVVDQTTGQEVPHNARTSRGTYFEHQSHPVIIEIEKRVTQLFGFPLNHQEAVQILNYSVGAEYKPHFDYFPPENKGNEAIIAKSGQRLATLIMYLNTPLKGGSTILPVLGLDVSAKKGHALYFENVDIQGHLDPRTLHGGTPVIEGEKWIATKWFREKSVF